MTGPASIQPRSRPARGFRGVTMPMLAAVISDTLYLYPADRTAELDAALTLCRDAREGGRRAPLADDIAMIVRGWREATEEEADRFTGWPDPEGDAIGLPFPG